MSTNPCPQNIWNHTDGCTCVPNGSVTAEVDTDLVTAAEAPSFTAVGDCPDCGQPMLGYAGNGKFVPGAYCEHCHHTVDHHEWEGEGIIGEPVSYSLTEYVYIRGTSFGEPIRDIEPSDERWADMVREQGYDPVALMRANLAVTDAHLGLDRETARLDYAHLGEVYGILLNREHVPAHVIIARSSIPEDLAADDEEIERAIDELRDPIHEYEYGEDYEFGPEDWKNVEDACREADLPVMRGFYESMVNRDLLNKGHVVNADTVLGDYERVVAPAIDRIENRLIAIHGDVLAGQDGADVPYDPTTDPNTKHEFAGWRKVPSKRGGLKSPKCTCGWEGGPQHAVEGLKQFEAHQKNPAGD
jgi:hypothetical protein